MKFAALKHMRAAARDSMWLSLLLMFSVAGVISSKQTMEMVGGLSSATKLLCVLLWLDFLGGASTLGGGLWGISCIFMDHGNERWLGLAAIEFDYIKAMSPSACN